TDPGRVLKAIHCRQLRLRTPREGEKSDRVPHPDQRDGRGETKSPCASLRVLVEKIQSTKFEIRKKFQISNSNVRNISIHKFPEKQPSSGVLSLGISVLRIWFGFRDSDFEFATLWDRRAKSRTVI